MLQSDAVLTALLLAFVAVSEGVRRLPNDTIVLRRTGFGWWMLAEPWDVGAGLRVVSWCIPVSVPIVLPRETAPYHRHDLKRGIRRLAARRRRTHVDMIMLQVVGLSVLLLLLALPFVVVFRGAHTVTLLVGLLAVASLTQAGVAYAALTRAGSNRRQAFAIALRLIWPFAATRAPEVVQAQVVEGLPRMAVLHAVLGEAAFLHAFRPLVHDILTTSTSTDEAAVIITLVSRETLVESVQTPPAGADGQPYCPRCATLFRRGTERCSDCGTPLMAGLIAVRNGT